MQRILYLFILLSANFLFAGVEILENSDGKIIARIKFNEFVYEKGKTPRTYLNFTAENGSTPNITATPQNKFVKTVPDKVEKQTIRPTISASHARDIPLFTAAVSPVLSTSGNQITYTNEMLITITYTIPARRSTVPRNDYYDAVSESIINKDKIPNTIIEKRKMLRSVGAPNTINSHALRFWIGDAPSSTDEKESDLQAKSGIYRITPSDLSNLGSNIPINSIKIRAANPNVANSVTPYLSAFPKGLVDVPVILRDRNSNGVFDGNDEILFYAEKIHTWYFDETKGAWDFLFNYTDYKRYYWITADEVSYKMPGYTQGTAGEIQKTGDIYYRGKRSSIITTLPGDNYGHGDKRFVWAAMKPNTNTINSISFPNNFFVNSVSGENTAQIKFLEYGRSGYSGFEFTTGNTRISDYTTDKWHSFNNLRQSSFDFSVKLSENGYFDFDGYALKYSQNLSMGNKAVRNLQFYSKGENNLPVSYEISDLPQQFHIIVRHNPNTQQTQLIDSGSTAGNITFSDNNSSGFKYHIATESGFLSIPKETIEIISPDASNMNSPFQITDITSPTNYTDYLIIAPSDKNIAKYALQLADHKQKTMQFNSPRVVSIDDIFKVFSGGVFSPEAIRNFMLYAQNNWQGTGSYIVLFGDGHFDYKNIISNSPNIMPVYMSPAISYEPELISYPIEDFFAYTKEGTLAGSWSSTVSQSAAFPSAIVARIPINNADEAKAYVDKVIALENSNADYSYWRNRPLLIADDDIMYDLTAPEKLPHAENSDDLGNIIAENDKSADIRKITLFEYPFDNKLKTLARRALIAEMNRGVSVANYIGHGSYTTLSDQRIFEDANINSLTNTNMYFIFGAFSCSVGYFDHPTIDGLSEELVRAANRGAINSIASARTAYSNENALISNKFFRVLYDNQATNTVGQAYLGSKAAKNPPTFSLLGDPSYIPMLNRKRFSDIKILDANKEAVDTLKKMQNVIVTANIGTTDDGVARIAEVILQNPENTTSTRKDGLTFPVPSETDGKPYQYTLPGMITLRQSVEFVGNYFEVPLIIPPTVIDTTAGSSIRIHVRSKNGGNEIFTGAKDDGIIFFGFDETNIDLNDKEGPSIAVFRNFKDTDGVIDTTKNTVVGNRIIIDGFKRNAYGEMLTAGIDVRISDKSGVDIFSTDAPNGAVAVSIERVWEKRQFGMDELTLINDDFRNVSMPLQFAPSDFPAVGEYEMTITTRDILQNITTQRYILDVKSLGDEQYTIGDFFCYPSPVSMGQTTQFFFNQPFGNVSDISLKIYTLNGKLVRSFPSVRRGQTWDLRDQYGRKLSPNVYLYRLFVKRYKRSDNDYQNLEKSTELIKSKIKKLVIYPPK